MQREDVERPTPERVWLKFLDGIVTKGRSNKPMVDGTEFVRTDLYAALLDRTERAEAMLAAKSKVNHELIRGQAEILAANHRLLAERDAAFAAGQEEMRERAAAKMEEMADGVANASAHPMVDKSRASSLEAVLQGMAETIRALPIKPRP